MNIRKGIIQQRILLLLWGGLALSLSRSPRTQFKILEGMIKEWKDIPEANIRRAINSLYASRLVGTAKNRDGTVTLSLTEKGRKVALTYNVNTMKIKRPAIWDGKWRVVVSDIPEKKKKIRNALHDHLLHIGFHPLQRSVFVCPFECRNEVEYIIELYQIRAHVRVMVVETIDNELHLKHLFKLHLTQ